MIFAATPNPGLLSGLSWLLALKGELIGGDELAGLEVSVREGGGAMAAPPEVAVEKQSQLVGL